MNDLVIEVGIPSANNKHTIRETLESLTKQSRKPDRIIIVDNSTDSTPEIIKRISETTEVDVDIYTQSNRGNGVGGARQDIYEKFQGDILACIDTDNKVHTDWIKEHIQFHKENPKFGILSNSDSSNEPINDPKNSDYFGQSNCSLKKEALKNVNGWDRHFARGEDWDIRIRLWSSGVKSYATTRINEEETIGTEGKGSFIKRVKMWSKKKLSSPSSAFFLNKYGLWYLRFHPKHVIGDILSIISIVSIVTSSLLLLSGLYLISVALITVPILFALTYTYYKGPKKKNRWFHRSDFVAFPVFFILAISFISSIIELIGNDYDWNYNGFNGEM